VKYPFPFLLPGEPKKIPIKLYLKTVLLQLLVDFYFSVHPFGFFDYDILTF